MNLDKKISGKMKNKLKKIEEKARAQEVEVPAYIDEWSQNIKSGDRRAAAAYLSIPEDKRPENMLNANDLLYQNLDRKAFLWANKYSDLARTLFEKDSSDVPRWCSILAGIMNYEARVLAGIAHELPEGQPPLHWSQFTTEMPFARPPGFVEPLEPAKNYRKKT